MAYLDYIKDIDLENEVKHMYVKAARAKSNKEKNFAKNVIDPFSAMFQISGFDITHEEWYEDELSRQAQKALQNHVGDFHQKILGHVEGWEDMKTGKVIDLVNRDKKILAEIKNKFNTLNASQRSDLYYSLEKLIAPKSSEYKDYMAYYVFIVPKSPKRTNLPYTPSDKNTGIRCHENRLIKEIDGSSFYALVTGQEDALESLYSVLPQVIQKVTGNVLSSSATKHLKEYFNSAFISE